jgi:hypothetical protein
MTDARYFGERATILAAAARDTRDRWVAERLAELAAHFASMAVAAAHRPSRDPIC